LSAGSQAALEMFGIGQTYGRWRGERLRAIRDVDVVVDAGEFVALVGPSGCGKSTLIRLAVGLLEPSQGLVRVYGHGAAEARRHHLTGIVFQDPALLPWRTTLANVAVPAELTSMPAGERRARAARALKAVALRGFEGYLPQELSGGMRQRASVARALVLGPRLLLLDEPLAALDQITKEALQEDLSRVWAAADVACMLVTHSIEEAVFMSDRIIVLTARPATVAGIVRVGAGRPRDADFRFAPQFIACRREVRALLEAADGTSHEEGQNVDASGLILRLEIDGAVTAARARRKWLPAVLSMAAIVAIAVTLLWALNVPDYVIPRPSQLLSGISEYRSLLVANLLPTAIEASLGFTIGNAAAVAIAMAGIQNRHVMKMLLGCCLALRSVPVVALAPVLTIWLGLFLAPKVAIVVLLVFFPTLIVVIQGLTSVQRDVVDVFTTLDATRLQLLVKARIPASIPHLFSALKIAAPTAVSGAVVAEWLQADKGIGHLMAVATYQFQITLLWTAIFSASLLGAASYLVIVLLERCFVRWSR